MMSTYTGGPLDANTLPESPVDRENLRTAGKWAKFISVLGLAVVAFSALGVILFIFTSLAMLNDGGGILLGAAIIWALILLVYAYPFYKLYQFASNITTAVESGNPAMRSDAFAALKSYFKFLGILIIAMIVLYFAVFVIAAVGGAVLPETTFPY